MRLAAALEAHRERRDNLFSFANPHKWPCDGVTDVGIVKAEADVDADILTALGENLSRDGQQSLKSMAALSVALGSSTTDPQRCECSSTRSLLYANCGHNRLGADIVELTKIEFDVQQQAQRITDLQERLDGELSKLRDMLSEVQDGAFTTPPSFPQKTAEWTRGTKLLSAKLVDYRERLSSASHAAEPAPSIQKVVTQEQNTLSLKAKVKDVEAEVRGFQGLPYNKQLALLEVERVRRDLEALKRSRDSLFEGLVEKGGLGGELGDRDGLD